MIKKLAASIRQYKRDSILAPVFVTMEVVMEVVIPVLMANLIDFGIEEGNMGYILKIGADPLHCHLPAVRRAVRKGGG